MKFELCLHSHVKNWCNFQPQTLLPSFIFVQISRKHLNVAFTFTCRQELTWTSTKRCVINILKSTHPRAKCNIYTRNCYFLLWSGDKFSCDTQQTLDIFLWKTCDSTSSIMQAEMLHSYVFLRGQTLINPSVFATMNQFVIDRLVALAKANSVVQAVCLSLPKFDGPRWN